MCLVILIRHPGPAWGYGVDVPVMLLEQHESGIHALCIVTGGVRVTKVHSCARMLPYGCDTL
jgi:hypothetical protein